MHTYDPCVLLHEASLWHLPMNASLLSVSVVKLEGKNDKNEIHENINLRHMHFVFYQRAIGTQ